MKTKKSSKNSNGVKDSGHKNGVVSHGRDCHGQQMVPDCHPATSLNNKAKKIASWNVRTLLVKGKLENVKHEIKRLKLNILGMSEVRWTGAGEFDSDGYRVIYSGRDKHERGVSIILDPVTKSQ